MVIDIREIVHEVAPHEARIEGQREYYRSSQQCEEQYTPGGKTGSHGTRIRISSRKTRTCGFGSRRIAQSVSECANGVVETGQSLSAGKWRFNHRMDDFSIAGIIFDKTCNAFLFMGLVC
jgi:hypothetical protein